MMTFAGQSVKTSATSQSFSSLPSPSSPSASTPAAGSGAKPVSAEPARQPLADPVMDMMTAMMQSKLNLQQFHSNGSDGSGNASANNSNNNSSNGGGAYSASNYSGFGHDAHGDCQPTNTGGNANAFAGRRDSGLYAGFGGPSSASAVQMASGGLVGAASTSSAPSSSSSSASVSSFDSLAPFCSSAHLSHGLGSKQSLANSSTASLASLASLSNDRASSKPLAPIQSRFSAAGLSVAAGETRSPPTDSRHVTDAMVVSMQARVRGNNARNAVMSSLRQECLQLRAAVREKDMLLSHSFQELGHRASLIEQLKMQVDSLQQMLGGSAALSQMTPMNASALGGQHDRLQPTLARKQSSGHFSLLASVHDAFDSSPLATQSMSMPSTTASSAAIVADHHRVDDMFHEIKNLSLEFAADDLHAESPQQSQSQQSGLGNPHGAMLHEMPSSMSASSLSSSAGTSTATLANARARSSSSIWAPPAASDASRGLGVTAAATEQNSLDYVRYIWTPPVAGAFSVSMSKDAYQPNEYNSYANQTTIDTTSIGYEYGLLDYTSASSQQPMDIIELRHTLKSMVEKIIKTNDQPASIYLQQRIKSDTPEIKALIFDAVFQHVILLMKNRFGNFLVQCCLEYGSPSQMRSLGTRMRGHVLHLACDRFGCHVMQKAIERMDEDIKTAIVSELLKCVTETFTHRFACHVWQRVFETRWMSEPPPIMSYIHATLKGNWAMIANDENGSLVVQCIFENCSDAEKMPIVSEIFEHTVDIAKGQWGNWVIQHLLEHGSLHQRAHIIEIVTHNVFPLSIDQYASKVVEKCIRVASKPELHLLIDYILSLQPSEQGRPYLLGMMNNQYANYVVQNVLSSAETSQRDTCIRLLAPHLHILRGSKYGQRVATMCEKYMRLAQHKFNGVSHMGQGHLGFH
ncbi:armadillo-type protein [Entophlyctis helioformis]|nr:armadillo-type protein [Entophlyctis helioformis]